jgi:hypothetical protein
MLDTLVTPGRNRYHLSGRLSGGHGIKNARFLAQKTGIINHEDNCHPVKQKTLVIGN